MSELRHRYCHPTRSAGIRNAAIGGDQPPANAPLNSVQREKEPGSEPAISTLAKAADGCGRGWYYNGRRCVPQDSLDAVDSRAVVVSGSVDRNHSLMDARTAGAIGKPLEGHRDEVSAVALVAVDGRAVVVSGSFACGTRGRGSDPHTARGTQGRGQRGHARHGRWSGLRGLGKWGWDRASLGCENPSEIKIAVVGGGRQKEVAGALKRENPGLTFLGGRVR